ncbi:hypothetical protein G6F70_002021 [Rhizopus microsporus]|nr:hypothetical protein G6F71_006707 [Rhizopus microsporus]KAG1202696.1 hypothetical protein G6F70_002021 [Rhizopus microsporus]KAG1209086.1 hypothetical protein G6F69_006663 [Rhizopus microsporus]KAG1227505.1 hypothetical protein G6F67_008413 [Rhizopus microsporus]KAG1259332.1 hypothetical protein G6F68_008186 [Rhizopus microsporus]
MRFSIQIARRRKCMYLKNPDENYIRLEPIDSSEETSRITTNGGHVSEDNKIYLADKADNLFAAQPRIIDSNRAPSDPPSPQQPATRPDRMIEQLTDGLVQLTLNSDTTTTKLDSDKVTPWRSYGQFIRWTPEPHLPSYYSVPIDMPSRLIQEQLIGIFFNECHHILPILSRSMFYDQLKVKGPLVTPLLLNIMYAHAVRKAKQSVLLPNIDVQEDVFYHRARKLVDDFLDVPRISTVIALLYMTFYECDQNRQRSSRAWMYSGMAIRMCFELGLHTSHYSSQMPQCDIELRKRVLWTCFVMDKLQSCTMERPWMLKSKDIEIDLPSQLPEDTVYERLVLEAFTQLCRLMMLVEKVIRFFTYDVKDEWTMKEENQILQYLDAIHRWREMLPMELRWTEEEIPASAVIANLHLICYDLELSLIMCCRQDQHIRDRRHALASTITEIVSLTVQYPHLMYTSAVSAFSAVFAALTHVVDFDSPELDVAKTAKVQFRKSLEDIRLLVEKIPMGDLRSSNFSRLIDVILQPKHQFYNNHHHQHQDYHNTYASAFSEINDLCHKQNNLPSTSSSVDILAGRQDILDNSYIIPANNSTAPFSIESCYQHQVSGNSSPSGSVSAAAMAAAAAAVGAVGTPGSTPRSSSRSIEPADYTFELISVADEWARSLMY